MNGSQTFDKRVTRANLASYYEDVFPAEEIEQFLTHNGQYPLKNRDIFLSVRNNDNDKNNDMPIKYARIGSSSPESLETTLVNLCPYRIDIAGVMCIPSEQKLMRVLPNKNDNIYTFKELVFDIDTNPFNWSVIKQQMKILDDALRTVFGYQEILHVFSGKKGIHCWVCDEEACELENYKRLEIIDYLLSETELDGKYLDVDVIKKDHNSKMPFSIHPITGKICVPLDIDNLNNMDIKNTPNITSNIEELTPYIEFFGDFVNYI